MADLASVRIKVADALAECDAAITQAGQGGGVDPPPSTLPADIGVIHKSARMNNAYNANLFTPTPTDCLFFDFHYRPQDRYERNINYVEVPKWPPAMLPPVGGDSFIFKFANGVVGTGGRKPFPFKRIELWIGDGATLGKLYGTYTPTATDGGNGQIIATGLSAEPDEQRLCRLVGFDAAGNNITTDANSTPCWVPFNCGGKYGACSWIVNQSGPWEFVHPTDYMNARNTFGAGPNPPWIGIGWTTDATGKKIQKDITIPPATYGWVRLDKSKLGLTPHVVTFHPVKDIASWTTPLSQVPVTPCSDEDTVMHYRLTVGPTGNLCFATHEGYNPADGIATREDAVDRTQPKNWLPRLPLRDGSAGVATMTHPLWLLRGRAHADSGMRVRYAGDAFAFSRWPFDTNGQILKQTYFGIRHKYDRYSGDEAIPEYYNPPKGIDDPEIEIMGNVDPAIPRDRRFPHRCMAAPFWVPPLAPDPASAVFNNEHGHSAGAGPFQFAPDALGRMWRLRHTGRVEDVPAGSGITDPHLVPVYADLCLPEGTFLDASGCVVDSETAIVYVSDRGRGDVTAWRCAATGPLTKLATLAVCTTQSQYGAVGQRFRWDWAANLIAAPFAYNNPNVEAVRNAAGIVDPEDLILFKDPVTGAKSLDITSTAGLCIWNCPLAADGLSLTAVNFGLDCQFETVKDAKGDLVQGQALSTPGMKTWNVKASRIKTGPLAGTYLFVTFAELNFSRPFAFKPSPGKTFRGRQATHTQIWAYANLSFNTPRGGGQRWNSGGYACAVDATSDGIDYGTSSGNWGEIVPTDPLYDTITLKDGTKVVTPDRNRLRTGAGVWTYGLWYLRFGPYGYNGPEPLTPQSPCWGIDPELDYTLQCWGHQAP